MAFKDQSMIPKATFIEVGVYIFAYMKGHEDKNNSFVHSARAFCLLVQVVVSCQTTT